MRKTTIQAIVDIFLILAFVTFLILYKVLGGKQSELTVAWVSVFLACCSILCISKFILYRRQNFLYFAGVFMIDLLIVLINKSSFEELISKKFGVFIVIPGIVAVLLYLRYKKTYHLKLGMFLVVLGLILLLLFGIF